VRLEVDTEPALMPLDKAVALGVVVNELVTNAAKHAYPPPAEGTIKVQLHRGDGAYTLQVADGGPGLPSEPSRTGLGMRLVRSLAQQLGATLTVSPPPGAAFTLRLPEEPTAGRPQATQARLL